MFRRFMEVQSPPSHFRRYILAKGSWPAIEQRLKFRPKTDSLSLWHKIVGAETDAALKTASYLMAVDLYERLIRDGSRRLATLDEEIVIHECLMVSSSLLAFHLEDYFIFLEEEKAPPLQVDSVGDDLCIIFERMSLLTDDDIDDAEIERVPLYQECYETHDWRSCLSRTAAHVLTRLAVGEHFTQINLRTEDSVDLGLEMSMTGFVAGSSERLDEIGALLEKQVDDSLVASMKLRG